MCAYARVCQPHLSDDAGGSNAEALAISLDHSLRGHRELRGDAGPVDQDVIRRPLEAPHGDRHGFH
jgi:hypothetical protein